MQQIVIIFAMAAAGIAGALIMRLILNAKSKTDFIEKAKYDSILIENQQLKVELATTATKLAAAATATRAIEEKLLNKENENLNFHTQVAELKKEIEHTMDKYSTFKKDMDSLHELSRSQFSSLATDILEKNKASFVEVNKSEIGHLLDPLKKDLGEFRKTIDDQKTKEAEGFGALKNELGTIIKLNEQLSSDAQGLANALKSDTKMQGSFGEERLTLLLENEGLEKYIDFTTQSAFHDEEQDRIRKPDLVMNLPGGKHIIIDSKVSLTAYTNYFNAPSPAEREQFLREHERSVTSHIDLLAEKNYQSLTGLNSPDFVLLFMPIESALSLALNKNPDIVNRALRKKIVLVTPSTMVACLKIINLMWKKDKQIHNVEEVFRQCGMLHDKFVLFLEELTALGASIDGAQAAYKGAMDRLATGGKRGDTVIGRMERIKEMGAKTNKQIPDSFLKQIELLPVAEEMEG